MKRRRFLKITGAVAVATLVPRHVLGGAGNKPPSEKLNIAGIGLGGQGAGDLREMATENIVALCDVDWKLAGHTFGTYSKAQRFRDYRQMLDKCREIEACKNRRPEDAKAGFAYSGLFTESLLVGNLAVRLQKRIEGDSAAMKATNAPEAEPLIRKQYRTGLGI